jgi:hypothetical protein
MQSTLPGTASRWFALCASIAAAALAPIVLPELQAQPHAGSQTASASLHIQVTVVPIARTSSGSVKSSPLIDSIAYNLQTNASSVSPSQVTIHPLPSRDLNAFMPVGSETPAVVETTTFVVQ